MKPDLKEDERDDICKACGEEGADNFPLGQGPVCDDCAEMSQAILHTTIEKEEEQKE